MPGVPRPVLDLPAQLGTIRLKPASLDNTFRKSPATLKQQTASRAYNQPKKKLIH